MTALCRKRAQQIQSVVIKPRMLDRITKSVAISLDSLWANKIRSLITMLGIIIGVASVVLIISIGAGAQGLILSQFDKLGTNLIVVSPGYTEEGGTLAVLSNFSITTLKYEDILYLKDNSEAPNITSVSGFSKGFGLVTWRSESYDTSLNGTTASYLDVEKSEIEIGRFFTEEEERNFSRVAVLGSAVKEGLFGESDAVGQRIRINDSSYNVIGVIKERGSIGIEDFDDQILLPVKTFQRSVGVNHMGLIRIRVDVEENVNKTIEDIKILLREQHDIRDQSGKSDDFTVASSVQAAGIITTITDSIRYFLTAMATLSLVVGGIGIMNIMLISVTERTREIGLRKSIGANNTVVLEQFLFEAVIVTGIGGLIGVILGVASSFIISTVIQLLGFSWVFVVSIESISLALFVSVFIGLFFGFYPAYKASKLDPIEALRYE